MRFAQRSIKVIYKFACSTSICSVLVLFHSVFSRFQLDPFCLLACATYSVIRSGILCGQCKNYSLTLGSMECRQCTNIYLLLLVPFALAGILLIVFLSLTDLDMTVAAGTINGLLFYANIVWENKATFFPPETSGGFLAVFIAWLNLDFGISTCFYDRLDSYMNTLGSSLAFPFTSGS